MSDRNSLVRDVVIAGGGPVGLFLACELRLAGIDVLVLERDDAAPAPLKALPFGLRGLSAPTLDALFRRGLLDEVEAAQRSDAERGTTQASAHWLQQSRRPAGHFAGLSFFAEDVDASRWLYRIAGPAGVNLPVTLQSLESTFAARATSLGVEIRRGTAVERFHQESAAVLVEAGGQTFAARWLVGCDGGRSTVRKTGGFDFVGTDAEFTGYSIDAELEDPDALNPGRTYTSAGMYTYARPGTFAMVDFDGGAFHRTQPVTREHAQSVLRRISGVDVTLKTLRLAATWTDRARQAKSYRNGRVLLAGDAAHTHSPLGGQGLNLGLGDAMNLGWKLAATIRGTAPPDLLDSYGTERHPEGARILDWSRAQVALLRPTPSSRALGAITRDLLQTRDGATWFAERVWGVSLRIDLGGGHPLVGRSAPDFEFTDGTRLGQHLRTGKALLLDFDASESLRTAAGPWDDRLTWLDRDVADRLGLSALLVRPDGIVAWVGTAADEAMARKALLRWLGEPDQPEPYCRPLK